MAKGFFKGNNKFLLGLVIAVIALFLFYVVKRREGFQNNSTVSVGPPTKVPAKVTMPNMNNLDTKVSSTNVLDNLMPNTNTENTPMPETNTMSGSTTAQSATTVAVVKAKLDELKTLVDSM